MRHHAPPVKPEWVWCSLSHVVRRFPSTIIGLTLTGMWAKAACVPSFSRLVLSVVHFYDSESTLYTVQKFDPNRNEYYDVSVAIPHGPRAIRVSPHIFPKLIE